MCVIAHAGFPARGCCAQKRAYLPLTPFLAHSPGMATPGKPTQRGPRSKASRPETQPLAPYLAELLNPALNDIPGVAEAPARFEPAGPGGIVGSAGTASTLEELLQAGRPEHSRPPAVDAASPGAAAKIRRRP